MLNCLHIFCVIISHHTGANGFCFPLQVPDITRWCHGRWNHGTQFRNLLTRKTTRSINLLRFTALPNKKHVAIACQGYITSKPDLPHCVVEFMYLLRYDMLKNFNSSTSLICFSPTWNTSKERNKKTMFHLQFSSPLAKQLIWSPDV